MTCGADSASSRHPVVGYDFMTTAPGVAAWTAGRSRSRQATHQVTALDGECHYVHSFSRPLAHPIQDVIGNAGALLDLLAPCFLLHPSLKLGKRIQMRSMHESI
jgi:hypothetical protein